jgi:hypothetical protein
MAADLNSNDGLTTWLHSPTWVQQNTGAPINIQNIGYV